MERADDASLVVAVQRHDQQALAELYRRHGGSLFHIALRVLAVRGLAEEVVQDIFTRLWQSPERFDSARGSLRSFLLAQAHGRAIDIVRSETSRRRREKVDGDAVKAAYVLEDDAVDSAIGQEVRRAVETLAEPEREAISLAYFGGHSTSMSPHCWASRKEPSRAVSAQGWVVSAGPWSKPESIHSWPTPSWPDRRAPQR